MASAVTSSSSASREELSRSTLPSRISRADERPEAPVRVAGPVLDRPGQLDEVGERGVASGDLVDRGGERDSAHRGRRYVVFFERPGYGVLRARSSSAVSSAVGTASSRSSGIGRPLSIESP